MSEWLELLLDYFEQYTGEKDHWAKNARAYVHEAIKERNNLLQKLSYQLNAHEALVATNANLRHMEKTLNDEVHVLRGVHDRQAAEIHKLKHQIKEQNGE